MSWKGPPPLLPSPASHGRVTWLPVSRSQSPLPRIPQITARREIRVCLQLRGEKRPNQQGTFLGQWWFLPEVSDVRYCMHTRPETNTPGLTDPTAEPNTRSASTRQPGVKGHLGDLLHSILHPAAGQVHRGIPGIPHPMSTS